jgi:putative glutamine amidotransferase
MTLPPRILVTVDEQVIAGRWSDYATDYARAVEQAGGLPIPFHYGSDGGAYTIPDHDGLVTIGGVDVDPSFYGEAPHERLDATVPDRDAAELGLTRLALDEKRPLLAICRGAQLLNVACGGSLHQHIEAAEPHRGPHGGAASGWHGVEIAAGSQLEKIAGPGPLRVNSRHHQAVTPERLGTGLVEAARTDAGGLVVLEAIEVVAHPFALGVQWHPERPEMFADPALGTTSVNLFRAFVAACARFHAQNSGAARDSRE